MLKIKKCAYICKTFLKLPYEYRADSTVEFKTYKRSISQAADDYYLYSKEQVPDERRGE